MAVPPPSLGEFEQLVLLALHFAFGIVKVLGYDEPEAGLFMAFDLALIGLLARSGGSRRPGELRGA